MEVKQYNTPMSILSRLERDLKALTMLHKSMPLPPEGEAMQWLYDNLYLIAGQAETARADLSAIGGEDMPSIGELLHTFENGFLNMNHVSADEIESLINTTCENINIKYSEFCILSAILKSALVSICRKAAEGEISGVLMGRGVLGLIALGAVDMEACEERVSLIHRRLMEDPGGIYPETSLQSRQYLRQLCYRIAKETGKSELQIAEEAIKAAERDDDPRQPGVAAFLTGHPAIRKPAEKIGKLLIVTPFVLAFIASAFLGIIGGDILLAVMSFLPLAEVLRQIVWPMLSSLAPPTHVLQMREPNPGDLAVVAIADLVPSPEKAERCAARLKRLYYKNKGENALFLLLCDFGESETPTTPSDMARASALKREVDKLNRKHGQHFGLIIRPRRLNPREDSFAGRGRKLGALQDLFDFIATGESDFYSFSGDAARLRKATHCLALDADTGPTLGSIREMMSAAAHPVNKPLEQNGRVTAGYGILAPRLVADLLSAKATLFAKVIEGSGGVTAYDTAIADPYMDSFGQSIFAGKGLIDIYAYRSVLSGRLPTDRMLSHDIIEGEYLRCGLLSQVEFTDAAPPTASGYLKRLSRWVRGDFQNAVFLLRGFRWGGVDYQNDLDRLSKFKIADNLRRHLTPPARLFCALMAAALKTPAGSLYALVFILSEILPFVIELASTCLRDGFFALSRRYFSGALTLFSDMSGRLLFSLCLLPAQAYMILDAVIKAIYRSAVSGKRMLQWRTAAQVEIENASLEAALSIGLPCFLTGVFFCLMGGYGLPIGLAFCFGLPFALVSSRKPPDRKPSAGASVMESYASWAEAIWQFFEDYTTADNNYLPPDNVQFFPVYKQARRTSPTNIGFYLLSALSAADLGLIDQQGLYTRVERTVKTVESLQKYEGNLYNWYDTASLDLLEPPFVSSVDSGNFVCCLAALREGLSEYASYAGMKALIGRIDELISNTNLTVFYDKSRRLFTIGIDEKGERSHSCYDFFMSESRLMSYYAVASGVAEKKHWGRLSRAMSRSGPHAGPLSWTGTLFEYFMPALLLPGFEGSLTDEALRFCLYCQQNRGKAMSAPWGISESGFYAFDKALNYQYKAHGVQKNGVKQGLDRDFVVAPYATFLAAPFAPNTAYKNLIRLKKDGVYGQYGFYEAADYRNPGSPDVVRSYMSHHMGMSLTAINNLLRDGILQRRFVRNPEMEAGAELLQEKVSKKAVIIEHMGVETKERNESSRGDQNEVSVPSPFAATGHILTNGMITEILSDSGSGYLWANGVELTRRNGDPIRPQGIFTAINSDKYIFSPTATPFYHSNSISKCEFESGAAIFKSEHNGLKVEQTDSIHPKFPALIRQIVITNSGNKTKKADLLCYFEPVLTGHMTYSAHPAFAKMGVSSRLSKKDGIAFFSRGEKGRGITIAAAFGEEDGATEFLLDRQELLPSPDGIGGISNFPNVKFGGQSSHDTCFAARRKLSLAPGARQKIFFLVAIGGDEREAADIIMSMRFGMGTLGRARAAARFSPQSAEGRIAGILLGQMRFGRQAGELQQKAAAENTLAQNNLWGMGISGDNPIVFIDAGATDVQRVALYLRVQKAFGPSGCGFDLVTMCKDRGAKEALERELDRILSDWRGEGFWLLCAEDISEKAICLIKAASCHISSADSLDGGVIGDTPRNISKSSPAQMPEGLILMEGGGVSRDGVFYVDRHSPLPYSHIMSGKTFGTLVGDTALGYSFFINSRENKLTPWFNDASSHNDGERVILRIGERMIDLVNGSRAAFHEDYAVYRGETAEFKSEVRVNVAPCAPYKTIEVEIENKGRAEVEAMCAYYTEPVLGVDRSFSRMLRPSWDDKNGLSVDNPYSTGFRTGINICADSRFSFPLTGKSGFFSGNWKHECSPGQDPCAAVIVPIKLPSKRKEKIKFVLSAAYDTKSAEAVSRLSDLPGEHDSNAQLHIKTPNPLLDSYINHFAPNQIVAGRLRGRCGFYQCGGAYGFRDQLQDALGMLLTRPELTKIQILRAAAAQFKEGDVLHWWHQMPERAGGKKGVRTRCSDDMLWLPYVTAAYVEATGDTSILDTSIRFLEAEELKPGQRDTYIEAKFSDERASVYEHCLRAINRAHSLGEHGLPLIGAGDWNDGFSEVGAVGKGESVWLALFCSMVMERIAPIMKERGDDERAAALIERADALKAAVDDSAWDENQYLRAFFDDGSPMGGKDSQACIIDLLPQCFAVLAGMPDNDRVARAMKSAAEKLIDRENGIVRLFTPHFTRDSRPNPGYVSNYPAGIRENGGQYTHSAIWFSIALIRLGKVAEALELLSWINPMSRSTMPEYAKRYYTEPYYIAADIYSSPNTPGRGGWTIYTGAASWFYMAVTGEILGIKREKGAITMNPVLPDNWPGFEARLSLNGCTINIEARRGSEPKLTVDGVESDFIPLDGKNHNALLVF